MPEIRSGQDSTVLLLGSRSRYAPEVSAILSEATGIKGVLVDNQTHHSEDFSVDLSFWAVYFREDAPKPTFYFCAYTPGIRSKMLSNLATLPMAPGLALIHPSASVDPGVSIEPGTVVNRLVAIGSGATIREHVHLNRGSLIGHDCRLSSFVSVGPGAILTGSVHAGEGVYIGAGATILPDISLGANATIGAGAVVTKDVPPFAVVMGNPARIKSIGKTGFRGFSVV